jgi:hypothetical protein
MANKHYPVNEEFEVEVKVKVKINSLSNYHPMSGEEIEFAKTCFKEYVAEHLSHKLYGSYYEEVADGVDMISFDVDF